MSTARLADQIDLQPLAPLNPPKLFQLPAQQPGALRQVPSPVIGEEKKSLSRLGRLQIPLHVSGTGQELPDRPVDRLVDDAEERELLDRGHGLEDRQAGVLVHEGQSQAIAVIVRPQQVSAGTPGYLAGLGISKDDSRDPGNEDDGDCRGLSDGVLGGDIGSWPRTAGGGQKNNQEPERPDALSNSHETSFVLWFANRRRMTVALQHAPGPLRPYTSLMAQNPESVARAAARKSWPIRVYRLGEEPPDDLRATTTAAERVEMVWQVTLDAWALAGRTIPDYPRNEAPVHVIRSGVRRAESDEGEPA